VRYFELKIHTHTHTGDIRYIFHLLWERH